MGLAEDELGGKDATECTVMERFAGPECPECGCRDSDLVQQCSYWGQSAEERQCRFCGRRWTETIEADDSPDNLQPVLYHVVRCPRCGSDQTRVTSTRRPIRHHKCHECGLRFKSHEVDAAAG
jgi:transcriptional regulator NrdR family protein